MIDSCTSLFRDHKQFEDLCLFRASSNGTSGRVELAETDWPVFAPLGSQRVYRNKFCALCNGESEAALERASLQLDCLGPVELTYLSSLQVIRDRIQYLPNCRLSFGFPYRIARECRPAADVIDTCNATGRHSLYDPLLWSGCRAFHSPVSSRNATFSNIFSALCNQADDEDEVDADCDGNTVLDPSFPFVLVMSADLLGKVRATRGRQPCRCADGEIFDRHQQLCRELLCANSRKLNDNGTRCADHVSYGEGRGFTLSLQLTPFIKNASLSLADGSAAEKLFRDIFSDFLTMVAAKRGSRYLNIHVPRFRIVAQESTISRTEPTNRQFFFADTFLIHVKLLFGHYISIDEVGKQLLDLTKSMWNASSEVSLKNSFKAEPLYARSKTLTKDDAYIFPTLVPTDEHTFDYVLDISEGSLFYLSNFQSAGYNYLPVSETLFCPVVSFDWPLDTGSGISYDRNTGSVHHAKSGRQVSFEYVQVTQDGRIMVCADQLFETPDASISVLETASVFPASLSTVSIACQTVSVVCLLLVLFTYSLFPELRTLPGKNTLGMVITLLAAILLFEVGVARVELGAGCAALGVAIHYLLLSSFTWMLLCSIHMYRTFSNLLTARDGSAGRKETRTFLIYLSTAIVIHGVIVAATLISNYLARGSDEGCDLDLGYGVGICYVSNRWSLLLASVLPICVSVAVNLGLFVAMLCSLKSATRGIKMATEGHRRYLHVYARLSTLTGANWLSGVLAASFDSVIVWYTCVVLCGLQGVYVFAAFVCNGRVLGLYRNYFTRQKSPPGSAAQSATAPTISNTTTTNTTTATARKSDHAPKDVYVIGSENGHN